MYRIYNKNMFHCIIYLASFLQVTKKPSLMLDTSKPEAIKLRSFGVLLPRCGEWFGENYLRSLVGWVRDKVPPYLIGMDVFFQICFETSSVMEVPDLKYY